MPFKVMYESTPNPHSLKFIVDSKICDEIVEITNRTQAKRSPLALKILGFPWAKSVFLGENFVTVTKEDWLEWDMICDPICELIQDHLNEGEAVLLPKQTEKNSNNPEDSEDIKKIKEVLETDIQPAVAMDGGYIEFVSYENGIVYLSLQGACSGCPSSTVTLKQGIESRLKQFVPDIKEVLEV
ncbi:MAG: NifU family protein [Bdellovibrionaceae bacterium]|nr:NifU family protein [Pseudobdellovibrionaceae bacterium]